MKHPSYHRIAQAIRRRPAWRDDEPLAFPEEGADLYFLSFASANADCLLGRADYRCREHGLSFGGEPSRDVPADCGIAENLRFRYPFLRDRGEGRAAPCRHVVVLLHGLNERSFTKYVPWAYQLWRATGAAVALFPLAFHVNRVARAWGREVAVHLRRRQQVAGNENVHAFNAVISERLDAHPERFFWGGLQTYRDVVDLVRRVRSGSHPQIDPGARVDLVGYSAGGYLALALLLADEDGLFGESRGVIFESGAALRSTRLSSRLIVDLSAELALMKLYVRHTAKFADARLRHWLAEHKEGRWFRALCGAESERSRLEARLRELAPRLLGLSNLNDEVVPPGAMLDTLQGLHRDTGVRVEELALGVHENPFACPDYEQRDRKFVVESLDVQLYGRSFERFIDATSSLLR